MKYTHQFTLAVEKIRDLSERMNAVNLPDYLRSTCDIGLHEVDLLLADWEGKPLTESDEFFVMDQVVRRLGFVDDMTRDMPPTEGVPS